jgi:hypothetical protein
MARRFPPPWRTDKIPGGYVVRDAMISKQARYKRTPKGKAAAARYSARANARQRLE